ncbi:MAG: hypothetical protein IT368_03450 [Candidatus Hydrogenedentes bacterium]|nr:hypothetical protein [Candidatus Hydrogenedentota bacterium]
MNPSPAMEALYYLETVLAIVWFILIGPASGLLFAQIPPRMGARRLGSIEAVAYGFAFVLVSFAFQLACFVALHREPRPPVPSILQLASVLAFTLTILVFGLRYRRVFSVSYLKACGFALAQSILLLAMLGLFRMVTSLFAFLEYMVGT